MFIRMTCLAWLVSCVVATGGCGSICVHGCHHDEATLNPNPDVIAALRDIEGIREEQFIGVQAMSESGRAPHLAVIEAEIKLSESRIFLANAESKPKAAIAELRKLIEKLEERLNSIEADAKAGSASTTAATDAKIQVLQARIRLAKSLESIE